MSAFANLLLGGLFHAAVLFLVAAGLQLVFGVQKIVNLACGSFYALGAYFGITLVTLAMNARRCRRGCCCPCCWSAGLLMAAVGPPIERLLRTVYDRDESFQLLLTFALVLMFQDVFRFVWGANPQSLDNVLSGLRQGRFGRFQRARLQSAGDRGGAGGGRPDRRCSCSAPTTAACCAPRPRTAPWPRRSASTCAASTRWCSRSARCSARSAARWWCRPSAASLDMAIEFVIEAFAVVVIGGLGSMRGALIGALLVGLIRAMSLVIYPEFEILAIYLIVIAVLLFKPSGLFGKPAA